MDNINQNNLNALAEKERAALAACRAAYYASPAYRAYLTELARLKAALRRAPICGLKSKRRNPDAAFEPFIDAVLDAARQLRLTASVRNSSSSSTYVYIEDEQSYAMVVVRISDHLPKLDAYGDPIGGWTPNGNYDPADIYLFPQVERLNKRSIYYIIKRAYLRKKIERLTPPPFPHIPTPALDELRRRRLAADEERRRKKLAALNELRAQSPEYQEMKAIYSRPDFGKICARVKRGKATAEEKELVKKYRALKKMFYAQKKGNPLASPPGQKGE